MASRASGAFANVQATQVQNGGNPLFEGRTALHPFSDSAYGLRPRRLAVGLEHNETRLAVIRALARFELIGALYMSLRAKAPRAAFLTGSRYPDRLWVVERRTLQSN